MVQVGGASERITTVHIELYNQDVNLEARKLFGVYTRRTALFGLNRHHFCI